ncbi:MAG: polysaccharide deacetylase family protein [Oscillospiraceae bacterium]|nr:polysaccharide deacetylase family protein [Oscillospiraceae bacterium]
MYRKKILGVILLAAMLCLALAACGQTAQPTATPEPTPEPTPTPFAEPILDKAGPVTFDGTELADGSCRQDGVQFVKLSQATEAIGAELERLDDLSFRFPWRKSQVELTANSRTMRYKDQAVTLAAEPLLCDGGEDLLVPVESFCEGLQIGRFYDEEFDHLYCTPGAGDWELPGGHDVAVMMYHGVGHGSPDANLFVDPVDMEAQIVYMLENGYTPIWFEDLEHVEDYEKPVLLTFDDGWENTYYYLLPLLEKYNVKATTFIITGDVGRYPGNKMDLDMVKEMDASGLMSIQSHTVSHIELNFLTDEQQRSEYEDSKLYIARNLGKEPYVLSYPIGASDQRTQDIAADYFRFAVKMCGKTPYNTSEDPMVIYRFFPERQTPLPVYASWLTSCFGPDEGIGLQ